MMLRAIAISSRASIHVDGGCFDGHGTAGLHVHRPVGLDVDLRPFHADASAPLDRDVLALDGDIAILFDSDLPLAALQDILFPDHHLLVLRDVLLDIAAHGGAHLPADRDRIAAV